MFPGTFVPIFAGRCYFPSLWTENSPGCHFVRPCGHTKVASIGYFPSTTQLNQATFDLPSSAIICPTHKPSYRGNWTTRGYANSRIANSRIANSRTGQLADAIGDFACLVFLFGSICETASCPVHDLSSPRVD